MKKQLLIIIISVFNLFIFQKAKAVNFNITNANVVNVNVINSKIQIHVNALIATACVGIDSCRVVLEGNYLHFKLYTRDGICGTPYSCIMVVPPPIDTVFTMCLPPNLNGNYICEVVLFERCVPLLNDSSYYQMQNVTAITSPTIQITNTGCDSVNYLGNTYYTSGIHLFNYSNIIGCDSIVEFNANIINGNNYSIVDTFCKQYEYNGHIYYNSGVYNDTISTILGCDSIVTLFLTKDSIDLSISQTGNILLSNATNISYQWLDCNGSIIMGDTNQQFIAFANGSYAVILNNGLCVDTSNCITVNGLGVYNINDKVAPIIYPNPASTSITISSEALRGMQVIISMYNILGQEVLSTKSHFVQQTASLDVSSLPRGVYLLKVGEWVKRVVVE